MHIAAKGCNSPETQRVFSQVCSYFGVDPSEVPSDDFRGEGAFSASWDGEMADKLQAASEGVRNFVYDEGVGYTVTRSTRDEDYVPR